MGENDTASDLFSSMSTADDPLAGLEMPGGDPLLEDVLRPVDVPTGGDFDEDIDIFEDPLLGLSLGGGKKAGKKANSTATPPSGKAGKKSKKGKKARVNIFD